MNARESFRRIMSYEHVDRIPVVHWDGWVETLQRWHQEGMPEGVDQHAFFDAVPFWAYIGDPVYPSYAYLHPRFPEEVIEENDDYVIRRNYSGVLEKRWKGRSSIPRFSEYTFKTAEDWPAYKERLQPDAGRIDANVLGAMAAVEEKGLPVCLPVGSFMGWLRDWMGVEQMTYLIHDDADCFQDIVTTVADIACWCIRTIVPRMKTPPDLCFIWEDICGSTGPFVSPAVFRKHIAPAQMRVRDEMRKHEIPYLCVDSDGNVGALISPWLDAGMDILFPIEVGTWGQRPERLRRQYGKRLRMIGGFEKRVLDLGEAAIDRELESHLDLLREGGYLMMPDHVIPPGTPLRNYQYYLERVRAIRL